MSNFINFLIAMTFIVILSLKLISYYCIYVTILVLYKNSAHFLLLAFISDMLISIMLKLRAHPTGQNKTY